MDHFAYDRRVTLERAVRDAMPENHGFLPTPSYGEVKYLEKKITALENTVSDLLRVLEEAELIEVVNPDATRRH